MMLSILDRCLSPPEISKISDSIVIANERETQRIQCVAIWHGACKVKSESFLKRFGIR
jgi:hypothetical protein